MKVLKDVIQKKKDDLRMNIWGIKWNYDKRNCYTCINISKNQKCEGLKL